MKDLIHGTKVSVMSRMTHLSSDQRELLPIAFGEFVDAAATATGSGIVAFSTAGGQHCLSGLDYAPWIPPL